MKGQTVDAWLRAVARRKPTPGGGGVAAHIGANATALMAMVVRYSRGPSFNPAFAAALDGYTQRFVQLSSADAIGFEASQQALKAAKHDLALQDSAYLQAARAPLLMFELGGHVSRQLLAIYTETNRFLISDTQMVALMLECTLRTARLNIDINLKSCHASEVIEPLQQRITTQTPTQQALKTLISGFDLE